jgi:hypothetical protein
MARRRVGDPGIAWFFTLGRDPGIGPPASRIPGAAP